MSDTKFTPGPWVVENGGDIFGPLGGDSGDGVLCDGNDGWQVAEVSNYFSFVDNDPTELGYGPRLANISLIKSAPELYEALECLLDDIIGRKAHIHDGSVEAARIVLAKARGEEK